MKTVIYHANCSDGFCAAWVARRKFGDDVTYFPASYGQDPPDVKGHDVFILDFSYKRNVMRALLSRAHFVMVLDHHKTAEAELAGIIDEFILRPDLIANPQGSELPIVHFDMAKSGGRLTWEHLFPGVTAPWLVDYTEDRDLWRWALPSSKEANAGLRSHPLDFAVWDSLTFEDCVRDGRSILRYQDQVVRDHCKHAVMKEIGGFMVPTVNATVLFSEIAGELAKGHPFGACYFDRADGKRQWSLRSTDDEQDVSLIARSFGGGGHAHAAGFEESIR